MASLGEKLRRARVERGLTIAELAAQTKISAKFLEAIEADERHKLPAGFFYRNWVNQYAEALSLDVAAVGREVDYVVAGDAPPALPGQETSILKDVRPAPLTISLNSGHR